MYLRGSKWSMRKRRRKRSNPWRVFILLLLVAGAIYVDRIVVPVTPPLFIPTPTPTRDPESFINQAIAYFEDGKLSQAIDSYEQGILADPTNPANYVSLARVQILAGQYDKAIKTIKEHIALPAVTGYICPAPCEKVCRRRQVDESIAVKLIKRCAAELDLDETAPYKP